MPDNCPDYDKCPIHKLIKVGMDNFHFASGVIQDGVILRVTLMIDGKEVTIDR